MQAELSAAAHEMVGLSQELAAAKDRDALRAAYRWGLKQQPTYPAERRLWTDDTAFIGQRTWPWSSIPPCALAPCQGAWDTKGGVPSLGTTGPATLAGHDS